jgi:hypothetical protein
MSVATKVTMVAMAIVVSAAVTTVLYRGSSGDTASASVNRF